MLTVYYIPIKFQFQSLGGKLVELLKKQIDKLCKSNEKYFSKAKCAM